MPFLCQGALANENATWEQLYQQQSTQQNSSPQNSMSYSEAANADGSGRQQAGYFSTQQGARFANPSMTGSMMGSTQGDANGSSLTNQFAPTVNAETAITGATGGVDILDESLKYHSQLNASPAPQTLTPNMQPSMAGGVNYNRFAPTNAQQNAFQNRGTAVNGMSPQGNGMQGGGGLNTQAIGAIGAAALVGTFLQSGGVGGMLRSVGWDNKRHVRGAAIGY